MVTQTCHINNVNTRVNPGFQGTYSLCPQNAWWLIIIIIIIIVIIERTSIRSCGTLHVKVTKTLKLGSKLCFSPHFEDFHTRLLMMFLHKN